MAGERRPRRARPSADQPCPGDVLELLEQARDVIFRRRLLPVPAWEYLNQAIHALTGYTPEEHYADPELGDRIVHPEDRARLAEQLERGSFGEPVLVRRVHRAGHLVWTEQWTRPHRDTAGRVVAIDGLIRDVTRTRAAQEAAEGIARRLRAVIETEPECVKIIGADGRLLDMNPAGLEMLEVDSLEEARAADLASFVLPEHREAFGRLCVLGLRGESGALAFEIVGRKGTRRWLETRTAPLRDPGGEVVGVLGITRDISERLRAEQALRESEARFRALVQNAPFGIFRADLQGRFLFVNPALTQMLGYASEAELLDADVDCAVYASPEDRRRLLDPHGDGRIRGVEIPWRRKDGATITVRLAGGVVHEPGGRATGFEVLVEDVTARRVLEEQVRQAQTMEAVGRLAGGVAHDFNNILTAITGYAELLREELAGDHVGRQDVEEIRRAADRAAALTRQLLAFGRRQVLAPRVLDLGEVVQGSRKLVERLLGPGIELQVECRARRPVSADPNKLGRVIMRLAALARDAMPDGGCLRIECTDAPVDEALAQTAHPPMTTGDYVLLRIADTGAGLDESARAHLFEPFFAVKPGPSADSGLTLTAVYGIITQSGGHIFVDSAPGRGTCFRIYLPAAPGTAAALGTDAEPAPVRGGDETVLLVEDEDAVRRVARLTLEQRGYRVLEAGDPAVALRLAERENPIHVLLTDMLMPGMNGLQLHAALNDMRPGIPVLFMSGYPDEAAAAERPGGPAPFLAKPFTPDELARKVRDTLDAARGTSTVVDGA